MSLWIELTFCMLTVMQRFFIRPTLYCISLTFKCQSTAVVLVGLLAVAGMVLGNNVCPSFCPAVFLGVFETGLLRFSEFWHGGKNPQVVCDNQSFSKNFNFPKKNEEMCQKKGFLNLYLYCLLCSCTNPMFGKNLIPEIKVKILSASQIRGFF